MTITDQFLKDVSGHELQVIRSDGLHKHLRFKAPGTMCMHFDLITWPGYLCYTGDMGTYVFRRLDDMLQFFRRSPNRKPYQINYRYWAEKCEAADKGDGITKFSQFTFAAEVADYFEQATSDPDEWPANIRAQLWEDIHRDVVVYGSDGEYPAFEALHRFESIPNGFRFTDFERICHEYTHLFLWCCHALEWAIGVYDASKVPAATNEVPA